MVDTLVLSVGWWRNRNRPLLLALARGLPTALVLGIKSVLGAVKTLADATPVTVAEKLGSGD